MFQFEIGSREVKAMIQKQKDSKMVDCFSRCLFGVFLLVLICCWTAFHAPVASAAEVVDRIVAVVNDDIIVLQDVNSLLKSLKEQIDTAGYSEEEKSNMLSQMRQSVINQLINRKLIAQAAKQYDWLTVSDAEIDAQVENIKKEKNLTDEQLQEALKKEGLTMKDLRDQLKESALASALENYEVRSKIVITKEDVTQYYNDHPEKYKGVTTYHLRNIFIKSSASDSDAEKEAAKAKLAEIFSKLKAGESFDSLARKYSESNYANEGGELGNFKLSDLSPNLRAAIEPLSAGQYTQALETSDGYQILYVQDVNKGSDISLDSVYTDIENELFNEQYTEKRKAWIEGLRENAHIKIIQ